MCGRPERRTVRGGRRDRRPAIEEPTMRYVMLIHQVPEAYEAWEQLTRDEREAMIAEHRAWFAEHRDIYVGGEELARPETARVLRRRGGDVVATDGPFAEAREVLGSFLI